MYSKKRTNDGVTVYVENNAHVIRQRQQELKQNEMQEKLKNKTTIFKCKHCESIFGIIDSEFKSAWDGSMRHDHAACPICQISVDLVEDIHHKKLIKPFIYLKNNWQIITAYFMLSVIIFAVIVSNINVRILH